MRIGGAGWTGPALLLLVLGWTTPVFAQSGYDVPQLTPSTSHRHNLLSVFSGRTLPERGYSLGLAFTWTDDPLTARDPSALDPGYDPVRGRAFTDQTVLHVLGAYGIFEWLEVGFDVPVILDQQSEPLSGLPDPGALAESGGIGDLRFVPRVQLIDTAASRFPIALRIAASLDVTLPTGSRERFQGGPFRLTPLAAVEVVFPQDIRLIGNAGYTWREADVQVLDRTVGGHANISGGIDLPLARRLGPFDSVGLFGEVFHRVSTEALGGAKLSAWGFTLLGGAGGGLNEATGTPDVRVFASLGWARQWGPDNRGAEAESRVAQSDAGDPQRQDTDGDGYVDAIDGCPRAAEDRDGFEDADGCPDIDDDGDGITDAFDQCPRDAEDRDGFADDDGCPDPDNDRDGIPDAEDACPDDPEDVDGDEDADGCPDIDGDFAVDVVLFFPTDESRIPEESHYELDRLARTLSSAPAWVHVWIEGHADDTGSVEHNRELSEARARAVRDYLIVRGVPRDRLSIVGFGEFYNVRPNVSDGGKRANRRVEFRVAPRASVPDGPPPTATAPTQPGESS